MPNKPGFYDPDPSHLWNRLHRTLFIRTSLNGEEYGFDEIDPLLDLSSRYLLSGLPHERAIGVLQEFMDQGGEKLVREPVRRAVLQHDLLAVFQWAFLESHPGRDELKPACRALRARLASAIDHLAMGADEIRALPDTYAAAVGSKAFPPEFDPERPDVAFLPPDLFERDGPWVSVSLENVKPAAPIHAGWVHDRSAFTVFLRLPGGREATLAYLKELREYPLHREANTKLPQFPASTMVALVRQMILLDKEGQPAPTRITERVQFRVYRSIGAGTKPSIEEARREQCFFEFQFSRAKLFASQAGGLYPIDEKKHQGTEDRRAVEPPEDGQALRLRKWEPILKGCAGCHMEKGVLSVSSFGSLTHYATVHPLEPQKPESEQWGAAHRLRDSHALGFLRGLLER